MTRRPTPSARRQLMRTRNQPRRFEHAGTLAVGRRPDTPIDVDADALQHALIEENATLARELGRVQQRYTRWRDDCIAQAERLEAQLMRTRAKLIASETLNAALRDTLDALHKRAAVWLTNEELVRRVSDLRARNRSLESELEEARRALDARSPAGDARLPAAHDAPSSQAHSPNAAPRILCVGGRTRLIPLYRGLVERGGGLFSHASGTEDDDAADLDRLLDAADAVILQAGYVCRNACRAVESHCARTCKPCLWLDKPCVQAFARSLLHLAAPA